MPRTGWSKTDLSVSVVLPDGRRSYAYQMGSTDRRTLAFDAEETVTSATATLKDLFTGLAVAGVLEAVTPTAQGVNVTVANPPADATYLLSVRFTHPDTERRTKTLFVDVPA